jgi:NADPH:quinone reductase-like Zn-dependent oxidoreductase
VSITTRGAPGWEDLGARYHYVFVEPNAAQLGELARWMDEGKLSTHVSETFPLERAGAAHAASESMHTRGKIVLTMGD